jgi:anti-sigma B factor antagonist
VSDAPPVAGFVVREAPVGGAPGAAVRGEIDMATAPMLEEMLDAAIRDSTGAFVLDLGEVEFLDSSGITSLLRARALLGREDRELVLVCRPGPVLRVLEQTGVADLFATYESRDAAARALVPADRPGTGVD